MNDNQGTYRTTPRLPLDQNVHMEGPRIRRGNSTAQLFDQQWMICAADRVKWEMLDLRSRGMDKNRPDKGDTIPWCKEGH